MTEPDPPKDENFIPHARVEEHFKLAAPLPDHLWLDNWPADLPLDFDHQLLDLMGLRQQCCLLLDNARRGWVVVPLSPENSPRAQFNAPARTTWRDKVTTAINLRDWQRAHGIGPEQE